MYTFDVVVTDGILEDRETIEITVYETHLIDIKPEWNLISLPCYENIDKTNIMVRNNSVNWTWDEAVDQDIILDLIYDWNRTSQTYNNPFAVDTFEPGRGYWIQSYYDCELIVYSNAVGSGDITDLDKNWSLMGLPYSESLAKEDLIIHYDGQDISWENATGTNNPTHGPIILGFIYAWDTDIQFYMFSDDFDPGYGYWMFAYYECTLKK